MIDACRARMARHVHVAWPANRETVLAWESKARRLSGKLLGQQTARFSRCERQLVQAYGVGFERLSQRQSRKHAATVHRQAAVATGPVVELVLEIGRIPPSTEGDSPLPVLCIMA